MKILFACHRLPFPPTRGGKIRPFNIIKHFFEQGHKITVGSIARSAKELDEGQGLQAYCDKLLVGSVGRLSAITQMMLRILSMSPSSMGYFYSGLLHKLMQRELIDQKYDLVFVHCSSAAQYVRKANGIPSILDFGDMDSQKWLDYSSFKPKPIAMGYWLEGKKLERAEKRLGGRFDVCTCTTKAELEILDDMRVASKTSWFPNGVDADIFEPTIQPYDPNGICFIGRMDYYPNQEGMLRFCNSILPKILESRPTTTLTIVGANPSEEIIALGSRRGVTVTGTVDDVRPFVRRAALSVAPLAIAHGTQNKILESMAMGVPVVCSATAAGGVDAVSEKHILVADDTESFARQVLRLLDNKDDRMRLSESGRKRVIKNHNWDSSMQKLDDIIASILDKGG